MSAPRRYSVALVSDHQRRHVVALDGALRERLDARDDGVEQVTRAELAVGLHALEQPLFPVLLARRAQGLRYAVAERDEQIARPDRDRGFLERGVLEEAEYETAGLEPLDAILAHQQRRVVARVAVHELPVP